MSGAKNMNDKCPFRIECNPKCIFLGTLCDIIPIDDPVKHDNPNVIGTVGMIQYNICMYQVDGIMQPREDKVP